MPANIIPEDEANEEDLYEEIHPGRPQGKQEDAAYGVNESYVNMGTVPGREDAGNLYQNDPPIYQNINQKKKNRKSVFGKVVFSATGSSVEGQWNPSYQKGISAYPQDTKTTLEEFINNYEEYLSHIGNNPADENNSECMQFLLHKVFPYLKSKLAKTGITTDILNILVRLSCCKKCSLVTRHALYMILDILSETSYDSGGIFSDFVVKCESDLRDSILGQAQGENAVIDHEIAEDQGLRVFVYSRVVMIFYVNIVQGLIPLATLDKNDNYDDLVQKLTRLQQQCVFEKKEWPRYAVRCIKEIQTRLKTKEKKQNDARKDFLIWVQDFNRTGEENKSKRNKNVEDFLFKIRGHRKTWFDFHNVVLCLGSQIRDRPRNMEILRALVELYLKYQSDFARKWSSEGEWQTGLVLGSVLEGIVNHNPDKDTRTEACLCLVYYFENLSKRNSLEKLWARESLQRCLYGPVVNLRPVMLNQLGMKGDETNKDEQLPITLSMDHLQQVYKKQLPKSSIDLIGIINNKGHFSATFRGENATIKIPVSSKDDILREEKKAPTRVHNQLVIEAYTLRRLNSKPHPNILRVFAYDTSAQPYHLITERVAKGSLLQFLQKSRSDLNHMPSPSELTKMMVGVMDAVIYLNEHHLVHLAIMAANVLVAQDHVCKLTGFQFTREMTKQANGRYEYVSLLDETATRHAAPECFTSGQFSEKSVSWAIGVMLFEMHTYGVSPYNQYSTQEADQIRNHVIGGGKLKMEDCIRKKVSDLIEKCLQHEREKRPDLMQLKMELERIYEQFIHEDNDCPDASYPSLTNVDIAQTKDAMNTSSALEDRDKEKNIGFFGSPTRSHDIPMIRLFKGVRNIRELVLKTKQAELEMLKKLKHKNIVTIVSLSTHDTRYTALVTEDSGRGNLLQIVLGKQCRRENLVTFTAQIAQAMEYMHDNNMIHGDLRAENIMVFTNKVKLARLGRSKSVGKMVDIKCKMPEDAVRWSPPEVIKDSIYSHSSDVYSFGIMCFELFTALSAAEGCSEEDVKPFPTIKDDQVLAYLEGNNRPPRPESMPSWFYIVVKQCLLHKPAERPPFVLLVDALTSSKPFESCLLSHWMKIHPNEADNIKVNKTQPEAASHVIPREMHKTFEELHELVAVEVFLEHTYAYKPGNKISDEDDDNEPASNGVLQDQDGIYDDVYDYNKANCNFPASTLKRPVKNKAPEDSLYEQIPSSIADPRPKQQLPPSPPCCHPIQETGNPTLHLGTAELALCATTSIINTKSSSSLSCDHGNPGYFYSNLHKQGEASTSSPVWPSLPGPPTNRDQRKNNKDSSRSSSSSCESSHVTQTSSYPTPASRASTTLPVTQRVEKDEGAVGGEPADDSGYLMEHLRNNDQEYVSMNNSRGARECSWYSMTPLYEQQNEGSVPRDLIENNTRPACHDRPVPLPRNKKLKQDS